MLYLLTTFSGKTSISSTVFMLPQSMLSVVKKYFLDSGDESTIVFEVNKVTAFLCPGSARNKAQRARVLLPHQPPRVRVSMKLQIN